ncbi:phage replisome organizer protein [Lactococcus lactis]|uniref:phage replisome organizer protein n=2 Tax=Lactococcus lactis TaxID=1358 RepID=UPI0003B9FC46|nr:phage replisome organiser protein [Lactococcus lactis]AGY43706.1 replisome organizer [Lactococcus lactis subsp. lactis KLDS 4.0325]MDN6423108.1 phage replisome organizer protein [Tetragenococcus koreensis]MBR8673824.1 replisome organizer [Lactococcus lactis subsp. lactis]MBR8676639.1 replisome organizer [Lactococcus lactis subsp. lactis]MBR8684125.1 replisome organizer [Lactococcus lactis subsp. lactis]
MAQKNKTKIYFWIKLDENFFKNLAIKNLRRTVSGGDSLVLIYQQMLLSSLPNNGVIYYEGTLQDVAQEIALNLDEKLDDIKLTIDYFQKAGLLQIGDDGSAEMLQVPMLIGQETNWNKYKREKKLEKFQPTSNQVPTEIDIEKEIDKDIEKEIDKDTNSLLSVYFETFTKLAMKNNKLREAVKIEFVKLSDSQKEQAVIGAKNYYQWYKREKSDDSTGKFSVNAINFINGNKETFDDFQVLPQLSTQPRLGGYI